jgi:hypothetical protein
MKMLNWVLRHKKPNCRYGQIFSLRTKANNVMLLFPRELVEKMEAYCAANNLPMQSLVLAAYRNYHSKVCNNEKDIMFYSALARRGTLQEKNTGGTRIHFMPLRTIIDENETFKKACQIISENMVPVFRHGSFSSLEMIDIWKKAFNVPEIGTYVSTTVTFQPVKLSSPDGMKLETKWYGNGAGGLAVYLTVMDGDDTGGLKFYYEYQTHAVTMETINKLHSYMMKMLEAGVSNDEITVGELLKID